MYKSGPLDSTGGIRLPHRVDQTSLPAVSNGNFRDVKGELLAGGGRNPEPPSERSSGDGISLPRPVHKQIISGTQERRVTQTCIELEASE